MKNTDKKRVLKLGGYSALLILLAVAAVVIINLLVSKIPTAYTNIDLTDAGLYSLSDQTKDVVSNLEEEINIYLVATTGSENQAITELLGKYKSLSGKIKVKYVDPAVQPSFVNKYSDTTVPENSVIVESSKRSRVIPVTDIIVSSYSYNPNTGSYSTSNSFDGENQLTSAIDYVISDSLPVLYNLTGHGEVALSETLLKYIDDQNIQVQDLNILSVEAIPEDAACVLINSPLNDYTQEDADKLRAYFKEGGSMMLITFWQEESLPVLEGIMEDYGLSLTEGIVMEGDSNHTLYGYPNYLLPDYGSHEITAPLANNGYSVLYPTAQGITTAEIYRDSLVITPLLTTTDTAYSKVDIANMEGYEKEEGDIDGPFDLAVAVEDQKYGGRILWFTSYLFATDDASALVSGSNYDLLLNSFGWVCRHESSINIHAKDVAVQYLDINTADGRSLTIFFMAILPIAALVVGGAVLYKRKKR